MPESKVDEEEDDDDDDDDDGKGDWLPVATLAQSQDVVSVSVSAQDGILALGKAYKRSAPSLSSLPKVALKTMFV